MGIRVCCHPSNVVDATAGREANEIIQGAAPRQVTKSGAADVEKDWADPSHQFAPFANLRE